MKFVCLFWHQVFWFERIGVRVFLLVDFVLEVRKNTRPKEADVTSVSCLVRTHCSIDSDGRTITRRKSPWPPEENNNNNIHLGFRLLSRGQSTYLKADVLLHSLLISCCPTAGPSLVVVCRSC